MSFGSSVAVCRPVTTVTTPTSTPKLVYPPVNTMTSPRCCENGRPVMVDPITGNTICSCQIKTGVPAYLSRVPSLPETVYGSGTGHVFQPNVVIGNDVSSAFYPMGIKPDRQSESTKTSSPSGHSPYYIDHLMAAHPYNAFYPGFDLNSARRKNATRETTGALKAWLYEHRKNPYPTKGEKIMLAIITRMTLTQVSTWFANARRRLKKENKLDGRDDSLDDFDLDDKTEGGSESSRLSVSEDEDKHRVNTDLSDISDTDEPEVTYKPKTFAQRLFSPDQRSDSTTEILVPTPETKYNSDKHNQFYTNVQKMKGTEHVDLKEETNPCKDIVRPRDQNTASQGTQNSRPKIWSISEIISKNAR